MVRRLAAVMVLLVAARIGMGQEYQLGPDSQVQEGVPKGKVSKYHWVSKIFEGTERDYWVYVPAQYDGAKAACVMVFQDGSAYVNEKGQYRATVVFDNLIHKKEMPVTVGIFINPGTKPVAAGADANAQNTRGRSNRSFEYDTLSDQYARFLLEEILPEVGKNLKLTDDPEGRAICGASSGGICAFTVAWERPDQFRKVVSHIGSFTSIAWRPNVAGSRGGDIYPTLIRKTPAKPIRMFLQDGSNDLDNAHGNWFLANQQMAAALKFAKYDYKTEWGTEGHNGKHGGAILPETMRWLWRDYSPKN
jgi:enterochelin esterase-like enzyme